MKNISSILTTLLLAAVAACAVRSWLACRPAREFSAREPAARPGGPTVERPLSPTDHCNRLTTEFRRFDGVPDPIHHGQWPQFRGADGSNIVTDSVPLASSWPPGGPPHRWQVSVGDGHAGPAVRDGRVYLLDYDEEERTDSLRCLSLEDGREIWRRSYPVMVKRNHGMSRTVPAVSERHVVTVGPKCQVMCVERETGDLKWGLDLALDYGTTVPLWYTAQCPIIDGDVAVIAPAGRYLLMGVNCETGEIVWNTPNPRGWKMSHSSVVRMEFAGRRAYVYAALGGVVAVAADGEDVGKVLWETTEWNRKIVAPCPVKIGDDGVFLTAGHGAGSMMLTIGDSGSGLAATPRYVLDKTVFACEQQTPLFYRGHLFGVLPKDAADLREQFACMRPDGVPVWSSGKDKRFGLGPFLIADGKVLVLDDGGTLTLFEASLQGYRELASASVLPEGRDAWGPMALVDGLLLARDSTRLVCLDLRRLEQE